MKITVHIFGMLLLFFTNIITTYAQTDTRAMTYYDAAWKPAAESNASFFSIIKKNNDTTWEKVFYKVNGPRVVAKTYKDSAFTILHGVSYYYSSWGQMDSIRTFANGRLYGSCVYFDSVYAVKKSPELVSKISSNAFIIEISKERRTVLYKNGSIVREDTLNKDLSKDVFDKVDVETSFEGGLNGWGRFLNKTLTYPDKAITKRITGCVIIQFIVTASGEIIEPCILKSAEYSLDEEAMRVIKRSPRWIPAELNGQPVKSYKQQPIIFRMQ